MNGARMTRFANARRTLEAVLLCGFSASAADSPGRLEIEIVGLRNDRGHVLCDLFASASAFPTKPEQALMRVQASIVNKRAHCTFAGIEPGRYAISTIHDENQNGVLDRIMGLPSEGVGASRDARGHFGPPKFDDAAFSYFGGTLNMTVTVRYLL